MERRHRSKFARIRRSLICLCLALLWTASLSAQQPAPPPPAVGTLRVDVPLVNLYCTVMRKNGELVADLSAEDFEVYENGKRQKLRYFDQETDRPLTLAILLDTSGSQRLTLPIEKEAVDAFLRQVLRPVDLATLVSFDVNVDLLQDLTSEPALLKEALERARINQPVLLGPIPRNNVAGTRLYDAIYLASREKLGPEVGRKAILLVSDGYDEGSFADEDKAIEAAHRGDVIIYAIGVADPQFSKGRVGAGALRKLARETGGFAAFPDDSEELKQAFEEIAAQLRSQYVLSYTPTDFNRDGKFRKIEIKMKEKGLKVQARRGYFAPQQTGDPGG